MSAALGWDDEPCVCPEAPVCPICLEAPACPVYIPVPCPVPAPCLIPVPLPCPSCIWNNVPEGAKVAVGTALGGLLTGILTWVKIRYFSSMNI